MKVTNNDWDDILHKDLHSSYFNDIGTFLHIAREEGKIIYPDSMNYFKSLKLCSYMDTKVLIMGLDPYNLGQADGLSFSVSDDNVVKIPPSLKIIFDAIEESIYGGFKVEQDWNLERWARQGVLLLNRYLSVERGLTESHNWIGWHLFTNSIISFLSVKEQPVVFLLFGKKAQEVAKLIKHPQHLVIQCEHPAVAAYHKRSWKHNECFLETNKFLMQFYNENISW